MSRKKLTILSGAGISAESGISTFRDAGGLWEGHDVMEVASPQGWKANPALVLDFYNQRRRQLKEVQPNAAHMTIGDLEAHFDVTVVTQNVDDLHERGGSSKIVHLHGELVKARSTKDPSLIYEWKEDLNLGHTCELGSQLRPHIVWFGEAVPMLEVAAQEVYDADIIVIVGTSMQVYPAAGLVGLAQPHAKVYYIDPNPNLNYELMITKDLEVIAEKATVGMQILLDKLG
jgi:NAD-dependent deacetylase